MYEDPNEARGKDKGAPPPNRNRQQTKPSKPKGDNTAPPGQSKKITIQASKLPSINLDYTYIGLNEEKPAFKSTSNLYLFWKVSFVFVWRTSLHSL